MASQSNSALTPRNSLSLFRVSKLQELEKSNSELLEKNKYYENLCLQLRKDIDLLKVKNSEPKSQTLMVPYQSRPLSQNSHQSQCEPILLADSQSTSHSQAPSYETDEEELNREVGHFEPQTEKQWQIVSTKKRTRESPGNENANQKQHKMSPYWLSKDNSSSNRFAPLQEVESQNIPNNERFSNPPPIFVDNVSNIQPLISLLNQIA